MKIYKAHAKVNIFLKITGVRGNYHEIISRFMRVDSLYDELWFAPRIGSDDFEIIGDFSCTAKQNTIYKAYEALLEFLGHDSSLLLRDFMSKNGVHVKKNIPAFAGLGGGSSDAATFLKMCNEALDLGLSQKELYAIGIKVGADVAFFIYGYDSANVSGIGEIVEEFKEEPLDIEIFTPKIEISTPRVYASYRKNFYAPIDEAEVEKLKNTPSLDILLQKSIHEANDLFAPALYEYGELKNHYKNGYYFSGSGSSFFRAKERRE